jgi:hypothetical protein
VLEQNKKKIISRSAVSGIGTVVAITLYISLIWIAGRAGFASLLTAYAAKGNVPTAADAAVTIGTGNPETHLVRGELLETNGDLPGAIQEYEAAASLRPDDYVLWLSLARGYELNGESEPAIAAARRAIPLAPFYAQPHWQLGNILLRAGYREEGFKELGLAGASNPAMMPGVIELAWRSFDGNVQAVVQSLSPQTPEAYSALARYFRQHGEANGAIALYASAGSAAREERRAFLAELISAKRFKEASDLWAVDHSAIAMGAMLDPGFEQESDPNEPGFGWRVGAKTEGFHLSLDANDPKEGRSSLRVEFNGNSDTGAPIISQLVLIEPHTRYQLRFSVRTESIVSGGLPVIQVVGANAGRVLAQSEDFPQATNGWRDYLIDFNSGEPITAIQIRLQRQACSGPLCPIFGRLWLDNFSLQSVR